MFLLPHYRQITKYDQQICSEGLGEYDMITFMAVQKTIKKEFVY